MKKFTLLTLFLIFSVTAFCTTVTITASNSTTTFTPNAVTITNGDSVRFTLGTNHNAVEVDQTTWNNNDNTALTGGFSVGFGGGLVLPAKLGVGIHYYVCQPHANSAMKGTITVLVSGIDEATMNELSFITYPNPCSEKVNIEYHIAQRSKVDIKIYDLLGKNSAILLSKDQQPNDYVLSYAINRKKFAKGIYFIELVMDNKKAVRKLVIE